MKNICLTKEEKEFLIKAKPLKEMGKGDLGKEVLKGIAVGGVIASMFVAPGMGIAYKWVDDLHKNHKRQLKRNLKRLTDRGYLRELDGKYFITPDGHLKLYEYKIEELVIPKPKKWDRVWRIVSFDIPEDKIKARRALNKKLKDLGFITLQKSVFVYPYPCEEEFKQIGEFFGVSENIVFVKAIKISSEEDLIKRFKENNLL